MQDKARGYGMKNARAKVQRLRDGNMQVGWISELDEIYVIFELDHECDFAQKELISIEAYGIDRTAILRGKVTIVAGNSFRVDLSEAIKFVTPKEQGRYRVQAVQAVLGVMGFGCDVQVVDISQDGLGAICPFPVDEGTVLEVAISYRSIEVTCKGQIQYCEPDPNGSGEFRAGIKLQDKSRLDHARWVKLIDTICSAA